MFLFLSYFNFYFRTLQVMRDPFPVGHVVSNGGGVNLISAWETLPKRLFFSFFFQLQFDIIWIRQQEPDNHGAKIY